MGWLKLLPTLTSPNIEGARGSILAGVSPPAMAFLAGQSVWRPGFQGCALQRSMKAATSALNFFNDGSWMYIMWPAS
jgi:hypothetical protein